MPWLYRCRSIVSFHSLSQPWKNHATPCHEIRHCRYHHPIAPGQSDEDPCPLYHRLSQIAVCQIMETTETETGLAGCIPESLHVNDQAETFLFGMDLNLPVRLFLAGIIQPVRNILKACLFVEGVEWGVERPALTARLTERRDSIDSRPRLRHGTEA